MNKAATRQVRESRLSVFIGHGQLGQGAATSPFTVIHGATDVRRMLLPLNYRKVLERPPRN